MNLDIKDIKRVLELANQDTWTGPIPIVNHQIKIAINSLLFLQNQPVWKMTPDELKKVISSNEFAKPVLEKVPNNVLAYAIRLARFADY